MTTSASGPITTTEELLRTTLAACKYFQTWAGVGNATAALDRIYLEALPPSDWFADRFALASLVSRRPYAHVWTDEYQGYSITRVAALRQVQDSGVLHVRFEASVPEDIKHDFAEVDRRFKNAIGKIICSGDTGNPGLVELNQLSNYLAWDTIAMTGPVRGNDNEIPGMGDYQECELEIRWGGDIA